MPDLIFASRNNGKIKEVKDILSVTGLKIISLLDLNDDEDIIEDGITFEENAVKKAAHVFNKYKIPVIADDSGLVVDQLNGQPGVHSARYSGPNATDELNNQKLITELTLLPEPHHAKYVCSAVFFNGENYLTSEGEEKGIIILDAKGSNGFGYDPFFIPENYSVTMAELDPSEKNKISHRAKAFNKLKEQLSALTI
ncbi:MAG: RdgB/HAM1 family non-canonical purine NTP pyrophosphatase [Ignavibacteriaceae bacterium]|nr:RdgB/HAM1 family non-canonical purine NTP pyrophosphatase [Ignavibacteriaceae bacterium]